MPPEVKDITTKEGLNLFATETEKKLADIEVLYASKFEEMAAKHSTDAEEQKKWYDEVLEKHEKENGDLKLVLETTQTQLSEIKAVQKTQFTKLSDGDKMKEIGGLLLAMQMGDFKSIYERGGKLNTNPNGSDWKGKEWDMKAATNLGTPLRGDAVTGSILVPELWASEILRIPTDPSALMGKVRNVPMSARKINFPAKLTGVTFSWPSDETQPKIEKNPTLKDIELECETAAGWVAFTEELNEDSVVPLAQYFTSLFQEAWQTEFDKQLLNSATAPFVGILQNTGANVVTMDAGNAGFNSLTLDDLASLVASLDDQSKRNGAAFICHVTILDILRSLRNDNGDYIYADPAAGQPGTIYGYPVILSDAMPDLSASAASTAFLAFGNPKWMLHGDRVGFEVRIFSETSDTLIYDRMFLRVRLRQAFKTAFPEAFGVLKTSA